MGRSSGGGVEEAGRKESHLRGGGVEVEGGCEEEEEKEVGRAEAREKGDVGGGRGRLGPAEGEVGLEPEPEGV